MSKKSTQELQQEEIKENTMNIGTGMHGFTLTAIDDLPEYHGKGFCFMHDATGLELYHIVNDDPENFFSFIFKTPAKRNCGAAHIVEHSVLAGSRKFPLKDPFLELMKGSANTFLNAMTYPDKTVYPAASPIKKDYFNLFSVYADAVFFPLLKPEVFRQEGVRLEVNEQGKLQFDGVVFNEMKGSYANHDSIVGEYSIRSLFPDTPYGFDSGGDPAEIVRLTYQEFLGFHAEFYHPSNCRVLLYGNIPTEEQLEFLEEQCLQSFTAIKNSHTVQNPKKWNAPKRFYYTSPAQEQAPGEEAQPDDPAAGTTVTINWVTADVTEPLDIVTLELLTEVLLGNPGAPLYRAIIESGLGQDVSQISGMESDLKSMVFSVGIAGIDPSKAEDFEALVLKTLETLSVDGIPEEFVANALRKIEFQQRELRGGIPNGLRAMSRAVRGWLHGCSPKETLVFHSVMAALKDRLFYEQDNAAGKAADTPEESKKAKISRYLEDWIRTYLIENTHRSMVVVVPDKDHEKQQQDRIQTVLRQVEEKLTKKDIKRIQEEMRELREYQERDIPDEVAGLIPGLTIDDLPKDISIIPLSKVAESGRVLYTQELFTNGIVYVDLFFPVERLSAEELLLLPVFSRLLYTTGIPGHSYDEVSHMIQSLMGGFSTYIDIAGSIPEAAADAAVVTEGEEVPAASSLVQSVAYKARLFVRVKVLEENLQSALALTGTLLKESCIDDVKRLRVILQERLMDFSSGYIPGGSGYAAQRAAAGVSRAAAVSDQLRGLAQWEYLSALDLSKESELFRIGELLTSIRAKLFCKEFAQAGITAGESILSTAVHEVASLLESFPDAGAAETAGEIVPGAPILQEASEPVDVSLPAADAGKSEVFLIPASVNFTACAFKAAGIRDPLHVYETIISEILTTNKLWEKIRMMGGAYGADASIDLLEEYFVFSTYRDPRLAGSLRDFRVVLVDLVEQELDQEDIQKAVITIIGKDVRPKSPSEKSMVGLRRELYGITDELRRVRRELFLKATSKDIQAAAKVLLNSFDSGISLVSLCNINSFTEDSAKLPGLTAEQQRLPYQNSTSGKLLIGDEDFEGADDEYEDEN